MAFSAVDASDSSRLRRGFSLGPVKMQFMTYSCLASDTSGTVTADGMIEVNGILTDGTLTNTAAPTFSTNQATLAFAANAQALYTFTISSGNATVGALYSDGHGNDYVVAATVSSATSVTANGMAVPGAASGTLTKIAGTGDATLTYSAFTAPTIYGNLVVFGV